MANQSSLLGLPITGQLLSHKRDGNFEIYAMDDDGKNLSNLTQNQADDYLLHGHLMVARLRLVQIEMVNTRFI